MDLKNSDFPLIIRNKLTNWKVLNYTPSHWCNEFKDKLLIFREGSKRYIETPTWENLCQSKQMTLSQFFEQSTKKTKNWLYFDYKYMKDVLSDSLILNDINWADLGLVDFAGEDSTLWIGNEGAHTPCHMDTYGCNFVAQIFGRKLWVLIPPDETAHLDPVRVPYEESSIYSSYNFYTPNNSLLRVKKAYKVILHPGDVLYVPRRWWHYVENLDIAISINVWVPLDEDHESRLEESLIRHYVSKICEDLSEEETKQILNPNEYGLTSEGCSVDLINNCLEKYNEFKNRNENKNSIIKDVKNQLRDHLCELDLLDIQAYLNEKSQLHGYSTDIKNTSEDDLNLKLCIAKKLINTYCHPVNINLIKKNLLK